MLECFVTTLSRWRNYKNRLVFVYYNILRFCCFKESLQSVLKSWQVLKSKKKFFRKMSKYRNIVFDDFKSRFLANFFSNYRHRLVLEIPFLNHIFLKTSKYRTENLHFPSTGKYYVLSVSCIELISGRLDKYKPIHLNILRALTLRARTVF